MIRLTILFLLFSTTVQSQSLDRYYALIHEAESKIVNDTTSAAIDIYAQAFALFEKPFSKDIYNALICAAKTEDHQYTTELVRRLMHLGCDLEFFRHNEVFNTYIKTKHWLGLVKAYSDIRKAYYDNINLELRSRVESLLCRDQFWRNKDPSYEELRDSTFSEDDRIMAELLDIFRDGYPDEYEIGLFFADGSIDHFHATGLILMHNYTSSDIYKIGFDLEDDLMTFVKNGQLHNGLYAYLVDGSGDFRDHRGYGSHSILMVRGNYYTDRPSKEIQQEIAQNRKDIWLDQTADFYKKFSYQLANPEFQFFTAPSNIGVDLPEEILSKVTDRLKID